MKPTTLKNFIELAAKKSGPFSEIAAKSFRGGEPDAGQLEKNIKAAGMEFEVTTYDNGTETKIYKPYTPEERAQTKPEATDKDCRYLLACGAGAGGPANSLILAVLGAVREEDAKKAVGEALDKRGHKVDLELRQKLESRYIHHGPAQLEEDLKAFTLA